MPFPLPPCIGQLLPFSSSLNFFPVISKKKKNYSSCFIKKNLFQHQPFSFSFRFYNLVRPFQFFTLETNCPLTLTTQNALVSFLLDIPHHVSISFGYFTQNLMGKSIIITSFTILSQFYNITTREWWNYKPTYIYHFIFITYNSSYKQIVTNIVKIIVIIDLLIF